MPLALLLSSVFGPSVFGNVEPPSASAIGLQWSPDAGCGWRRVLAPERTWQSGCSTGQGAEREACEAMSDGPVVHANSP